MMIAACLDLLDEMERLTYMYIRLKKQMRLTSSIFYFSDHLFRLKQNLPLEEFVPDARPLLMRDD
jgi:hypothetical protein